MACEVAPPQQTERQGAYSYDAPGATYTHRDGLCSFEVLVEDYKLDDPALKLLARIVHGADVPMTVTQRRSRVGCSPSRKASICSTSATIASLNSLCRSTTRST